MISCEDNPETPRNEEPVDTISGTYHIEGYKVNLTLCYMGSACEEGEVLSRDTLDASFSIEIQVQENRTDTLFVTGLEGLDVSIDHPDYSGNAAAVTCDLNGPAKDCAFANLHETTLNFDVETQPGYYYGTGQLQDDQITLQTHFIHRGAGVDYVLSGVKQEE